MRGARRRCTIDSSEIAGVGHALRDRREGARPVVDRQADVVAALMRADRRLAVGLEVRRRAAESADAVAAGDVGDVAHHRGGGRVAAGAGPDSISWPTKSASTATALVTPSMRAIGRGLRHHRRVDALLDARLGAAGDAEQLDAVAELVGRLDVGLRDRRDALDIDRVGIDLGAEGDRGQERELVRGVVALDVEGRVGLGIAEPLGVGEAVGEGEAAPAPSGSGCSCRCRSGCHRRG